jgi:phosphotransferase family enzyme
VRPRLSQVPAVVRAFVEDVLREPLRHERPAAFGFTPAVASTVTGRGGRTVFVKAAPLAGGLGEAVRAGVRLAELVGDLAPRLLAAAEPGGWVVAVYEYVPGDSLREWDEPATAAMIDVLATVRERLAGPPLGGARRYADDFAPLLGAWRSLARRPGGDPGSVAHLGDRALPAPVPLGLLADLEREWFAALGPGSAMQHGDLRRDNVIRHGAGGRLWLVDWAHVWTGPGWLDLVRLAPDMAGDGRDPEDVLRRSCWADADPHAVNVALAGLAGRAWRDGHRRDGAGLSGLRRMQRDQATELIVWLGRRLGRGGREGVRRRRR